MRRAGRGDVVERIGHLARVGLRTETDRVEVGEHQDRHRERVATLDREQDAVAALGVLGDQRLLRCGHDQLGTTADGLGGGRGLPRVGPAGGQHDHEVEAPGPARQTRGRPGDERDRAERLEDRAQQARVGTGRDHGPGSPGLCGAAYGLLQGLCGACGHPADPGTGLGQRTQQQVDPGQRPLVVQPRLVEPGHRCLTRSWSDGPRR